MALDKEKIKEELKEFSNLVTSFDTLKTGTATKKSQQT